MANISTLRLHPGAFFLFFFENVLQNQKEWLTLHQVKAGAHIYQLLLHLTPGQRRPQREMFNKKN
jgi:hypothetical protein